MKALFARKIEPQTNMDFYRKVEGEITTNKDETLYFLKVGKTSCFIPPNLNKDNSLKSGEIKSAYVILDYNKKKNDWGWKCMKLL